MKWLLFVTFTVYYGDLVQCYSSIKLDSTNANVQWTLENYNGSIKVPGSVPGGVYSDLEKAGVIGDILYRFNDVLTRWVAYDSWTYTAHFDVTETDLSAAVTNLVFHGVDTIAFVELNGSPVGSTNNMFVRYVFDVKQHLQVGRNEIKVNFVSPVTAAHNRSAKYFTAPECVPAIYHGECHANQLRKMQASFGWDWGPAFPSVGLWKPVELQMYTGTMMRAVTTHMKNKNGFWQLKLKIYLESSEKSKVIREYFIVSLKVINQTIKVQSFYDVNIRADGTGEAEVSMLISENVVRPWWPNGYGDQPLYDLDVYLRNGFHKHLKIGFRTIEVIEDDASQKLGNTTAGQGLTFYFQVNGYPIFMKGSNWIPTHILPELGNNKQEVNDLLISARDTHMAMLRVWGGGVYESDFFYQRCDELGLLIWQDFLFACSMYPVDADYLNTVRIEVEQNVLRLQSHPCIAIWAGNNENEAALRGDWYSTQTQFARYQDEYIKLYVDTIKPVVNTIDPERRYLISSPSNGKESEKEGYISQHPYDAHYGDTHYYNYLADNWDANIYPPTRFASEYGFQSLPSLLTMRTATNVKEDFDMDSEYSMHRQHSPLGYVYIGTQISRHLKLERNDTKHFEKFVYYSQISQAMAIKAETEFYRQSQYDWYTMGALYWQLNDVWQAPSWSSIDHGGRWKMLHYFARSFFAPVLISPRLLASGDIDVYLINDRFVPIIEGYMTVDFFNFSSLHPVKSENYSVNARPLSSEKQSVQLTLDGYNKDEIFLRLSLTTPGVLNSPHNFVFPRALKSVKGIKEPQIQISVSQQTEIDALSTRYTVDVTVDTIVLFLWLEVNSFDGYFEENGFIVTQPNIKAIYVSSKTIEPQELKAQITYKYYTN